MTLVPVYEEFEKNTIAFVFRGSTVKCPFVGEVFCQELWLQLQDVE